MDKENNNWTDESVRELLEAHREAVLASVGITPASKSLSVRFSDIQPQPVNWLWPERIALGKITLIVGDPGIGKSLLTASIAAQLSTGKPWPHTNLPISAGETIFLSAEDDPEDTIRPRLDAAGADCARVRIIRGIPINETGGRRLFSLKTDVKHLEQELLLLNQCRLVIIDPVSAYLDGKDGNSNSDVRGLFAPLAELAARHKVAVVLVSHLNKNGFGSALYRTMGSLAFTAAARAVYLIVKDKEDEEKRLFLTVKSNLARKNVGLSYHVTSGSNQAPLLVWDTEPVAISPDEALGQARRPETKQTATDEAVEFLRTILAKKSLPASQIQKEAAQLGIGGKPLRDARERLGVIKKKSGFKGGWVLSLPTPEDALEAPRRPSESEDTFGVEGHLGSSGSEENSSQMP